jgi:hypothetical protein
MENIGWTKIFQKLSESKTKGFICRMGDDVVWIGGIKYVKSTKIKRKKGTPRLGFSNFP